ncbi:MAG: aldehyde ferredoxin oxidoreductase family protein [Thermosphaera sp.]
MVELVKGIAGNILIVDLSTQKILREKTRVEFIEKFTGGYGYAAKVFHQYLRKYGVFDSFSAENPFIIMTGPLTGVSSFGAKTCISSRSPLTGTFSWAVSSGGYGLSLKRAGFDGVVITGDAEEPVYLIIEDDHVDLKSAKHLWGLTTSETHAHLKRTHGSDFNSIAIGPAGEKLVKYAAIVSDERRCAARTGLGAVMGFKKLKAVAVKGSKEVEVYNKEELRMLNKEWLIKASQSLRGKTLGDYGTGAMVQVYATTGGLPVKNWTKNTWEHAVKLSGQYIMQHYKKGTGKNVCSKRVMCSIACERVVAYDDLVLGKYEGKGPEYESLASLGLMTMIDNPVAVIRMNDMCDNLGLDTISTGAVISWVMEAFERGDLSVRDTGGLEIKWGDYETVFKLIEMIANREGIGDLLAEGVWRANSLLNPRTSGYALHVKGLEFPYHDPRRWKSIGLAYATSNRGACHLQGMTYHVDRGALKLPEYSITNPPTNPLERANAVVVTQNLCAFLDSAGLCKFGTLGIVDFDFVARTWSAATGLKTDKYGILTMGERIWLSTRVINYLLGFTNKDDKLPKRFTSEPISEGPGAGSVCDDLQESLKHYYEIRGLTNHSTLTDKLKKLELDEFIKDLDRINPSQLTTE